MSTNSSADRIRELAASLTRLIDESTKEIAAINFQTRLLSFNARIEASRAGDTGRAFSVISAEMLTLSERTHKAAASITNETGPLVTELATISQVLSTSVKGTRLCDLAQNNINLVDRNLYERSCDCRWWATDSAAVEALAQRTPEALAHATTRLGVILKAYTVYFDIVLADLDGHIIANGRPDDYANVGQNHAASAWYTSAMATPDGDHYGFQGAHASELVNGQRSLIYSCKVCRDGVAIGEPLGVLGVVFNWNALAQTIVADTPVEAAHKEATRVHFVDEKGRIIASTEPAAIDTDFRPQEPLPKGKESYDTTVDGKSVLIAHAPSLGFETYKTGWSAVIVDASGT